MKTILTYSLPALIAISSANVSATDVMSKSAEAALRSQVIARWEALSKHHFDEAYEFQTPKYKAVFPKSFYVEQFSNTVSWSLTKISDIKYDATSGVSAITVNVQTKSLIDTVDTPRMPTSVRVDERWLYMNDQWWYSTTK